MEQQRRKGKKLPEPDEDGNYTEKQLKRLAEYSMNYCMWFIQKRNYTVHELETKLKFKKIPEDIIQNTLKKLQEDNYLNDDHFTENFVYSKRRYEKLGVSAIRTKLMLKGVDKELIDHHLSEIEEGDLEETALMIAETKARSYTVRKETERQKKVQKIATFLAYRGYSGSMAYSVANAALDNVEAEDAL